MTMEKEKKGSKVNYRLTDDMKQRLDALAARMGVSASTLVRFAIDEYVQKIERDGVMVRPVSAAHTNQEAHQNETPRNIEKDADAVIEEYYSLSQSERDALYELQRGPVGTIAAGAPDETDLHVAETENRPATPPRKTAKYLHPKKLISNKK